MLLDITRLQLAIKDREANPTPVDVTKTPTTAAEAEAYGVARQDLLFARQEADLAFHEALADVLARHRAHVDGIDSDVAEIEGRLKVYHEVQVNVARQLGEKPPLTITFDSVTLSSSEGQPTWVYEDDKAYATWVIANIPDAVKPPKDPEINKNSAKNTLGKCDVDESHRVIFEGSPVPGVKVLPAKRNFRVK
jgi:hypothetical protein